MSPPFKLCNFSFQCTTLDIEGLKWDIKAAVQAQVPDTMARAIMLAKVQQQILDNSKQKYEKSGKAPVALGKVDPKPSPPGQTLWKARQLRDYRRANNLCLYCGEKQCFQDGWSSLDA